MLLYAHIECLAFLDSLGFCHAWQKPRAFTAESPPGCQLDCVPVFTEAEMLSPPERAIDKPPLPALAQFTRGARVHTRLGTQRRRRSGLFTLHAVVRGANATLFVSTRAGARGPPLAYSRLWLLLRNGVHWASLIRPGRRLRSMVAAGSIGRELSAAGASARAAARFQLTKTAGWPAVGATFDCFSSARTLKRALDSEAIAGCLSLEGHFPWF